MTERDLSSCEKSPEEAPLGYPKNKEEWWQFARYYRKELRDLVSEFHPVYARWSRPMKITATRAEAACDEVRSVIEETAQADPLVIFDRALAKEDVELALLLSETWFGIPESRDAHSLPGFEILCGLCSEVYVLEEPGPGGE